MFEQLDTTLILPPCWPGVAEVAFIGLGRFLEDPRVSSFSDEHFALSFVCDNLKQTKKV
jgi:hypothetical protein